MNEGISFKRRGGREGMMILFDFESISSSL
jgi:hypothetical protein